jgi:hypothetical protein
MTLTGSPQSIQHHPYGTAPQSQKLFPTLTDLSCSNTGCVWHAVKGAVHARILCSRCRLPSQMCSDVYIHEVLRPTETQYLQQLLLFLLSPDTFHPGPDRLPAAGLQPAIPHLVCRLDFPASSPTFLAAFMLFCNRPGPREWIQKAEQHVVATCFHVATNKSWRFGASG